MQPHSTTAAHHRRSPEVLFWAKVQRKGPDDCWNWTAALDPISGYGRFRYTPWKNARIVLMAHRFSWQLAHGSIHPDILVLHSCDNRVCVNPAHLFLGTHKDNTADMYAKGRAPIGERNGTAKLTEEHVRELRTISGIFGTTQERLARLYGVSRRAVGMMLRGQTWKHVSDGLPMEGAPAREEVAV